MIMRAPRRCIRTSAFGTTSQRGTSAIEFAIAAPLMLLILWGLVLFANLISAQMILTRATADAARALSYHTGPGGAVDLSPYLAPCGAPAEPSIQCELLSSLARSSLLKDADAATRFAKLQAAVSIDVVDGSCGSASTTQGIEARLPVSLVRILPDAWGSASWLPSELHACSALDIQLP